MPTVCISFKFKASQSLSLRPPFNVYRHPVYLLKTSSLHLNIEFIWKLNWNCRKMIENNKKTRFGSIKRLQTYRAIGRGRSSGQGVFDDVSTTFNVLDYLQRGSNRTKPVFHSHFYLSFIFFVLCHNANTKPSHIVQTQIIPLIYSSCLDFKQLTTWI